MTWLIFRLLIKDDKIKLSQFAQLTVKKYTLNVEQFFRDNNARLSNLKTLSIDEFKAEKGILNWNVQRYWKDRSAFVYPDNLESLKIKDYSSFSQVGEGEKSWYFNNIKNLTIDNFPSNAKFPVCQSLQNLTINTIEALKDNPDYNNDISFTSVGFPKIESIHIKNITTKLQFQGLPTVIRFSDLSYIQSINIEAINLPLKPSVNFSLPLEKMNSFTVAGESRLPKPKEKEGIERVLDFIDRNIDKPFMRMLEKFQDWLIHTVIRNWFK